jgi:hypothetical protein
MALCSMCQRLSHDFFDTDQQASHLSLPALRDSALAGCPLCESLIFVIERSPRSLVKDRIQGPVILESSIRKTFSMPELTVTIGPAWRVFAKYSPMPVNWGMLFSRHLLLKELTFCSSTSYPREIGNPK